MVSFPSLLDFDPYLRFPDGARPIWPPFLDGAIATLILPFARSGDPARVEALAVWVPPILGAATVALLAVVARRFFDDRVALVSGALLCVLSAHFWYSQLGFVDHHAAVALLSTLVLAATLTLLRRAAAGDGTGGAALGLGVANALLLLVWPGGLLFVGLSQLGLAAFWVTRTDAGGTARFARPIALQSATTGGLLLPAVAAATPTEQWGPLHPMVLSYFPVWIFAALALWALATWALAVRIPRLAARGWTRVLGTGAIGAVLLGASAALLPELREAPDELWRWLAKAETFQSAVGESQPLFVSAGELTTRIASLRLSHFVYALPFALAALAWQSWRRRDPALLFLAGWCAALAAVALLQRRFMNSLSVSYALVFGWSVVALFEVAARRAGSSGVRRAVQVALVVLLAALLLPLERAYRRPLRNALRALRSESIEPDRTRVQKLGSIQVAEWMRAATPETTGFFDPTARPEYGVLAPWGDGHVLKYVGRRPVVVDNFGDDLGGLNFELSRLYFQLPSETDAIDLLDRLGARYVVVRPGAGLGGVQFQRLYAGDASGLGQHRLVFETPLAERTAHLPSIKVFESVAGARLIGLAAPGAAVHASLEYRTPRGRGAVYRAETVSDASGRYALRLPHATRGGPASVRPDGAYRVVSGEKMERAEVDESQVQAGAEVPGPDLRP